MWLATYIVVRTLNSQSADHGFGSHPHALSGIVSAKPWGSTRPATVPIHLELSQLAGDNGTELSAVNRRPTVVSNIHLTLL